MPEKLLVSTRSSNSHAAWSSRLGDIVLTACSGPPAEDSDLHGEKMTMRLVWGRRGNPEEYKVSHGDALPRPCLGCPGLGLESQSASGTGQARTIGACSAHGTPGTPSLGRFAPLKSGGRYRTGTIVPASERAATRPAAALLAYMQIRSPALACASAAVDSRRPTSLV